MEISNSAMNLTNRIRVDGNSETNLANPSDDQNDRLAGRKLGFAGVVLGAAGFIFAIMVVISESMGNNFIGEHIHHLKVTLLLCLFGVASGVFYIWNNNRSWWLSFLGGASLFSIYYGLIFFVIVIFTNSTSQRIRIAAWVVFGVVPLIVAIFYNQGKLRRPIRHTSSQHLQLQGPVSQDSQDIERPHMG